MEQMVDAKFRALLDHSLMLLRKKWLYGILDDFVTKKLLTNVTWGLSELAHALRYLASLSLQSFMAFGDILELHKKFLELLAKLVQAGGSEGLLVIVKALSV
ncbi:ABC transporter D family member 1 [Raphanus sativus]|nr:ABC transporter D family member 1 [Raphanus sativus]